MDRGVRTRGKGTPVPCTLQLDGFWDKGRSEILRKFIKFGEHRSILSFGMSSLGHIFHLKRQIAVAGRQLTDIRRSKQATDCIARLKDSSHQSSIPAEWAPR